MVTPALPQRSVNPLNRLIMLDLMPFCHDQGQIATKLKGFNRGVTVTAGLETIFTTPSHGTAYDIVGQGKATTGALDKAVQLAAKLAVRRAAQGAMRKTA